MVGRHAQLRALRKPSVAAAPVLSRRDQDVSSSMLLCNVTSLEGFYDCAFLLSSSFHLRSTTERIGQAVLKSLPFSPLPARSFCASSSSDIPGGFGFRLYSSLQQAYSFSSTPSHLSWL